MPKWDKTRNYYADLELSPNATTDEIKRQFKKLALKYHPDRNPGKEAEVNGKFQTIQCAHEILIDDTLKRQYDEARRSYAVRYPTSSGVRGNPWANVGKHYPPPPTRRPAAAPAPSPRPTSGAQRYETFTSSMPRASKPSPKDDPYTRKSTAEAWENMRSHPARDKAPPPTPARPPPGRAPTSATRDASANASAPRPTFPRTAYQQQKAQASFGATKRPGFTPGFPGVADEPPVTNKNYFTNRTHSYLFTEPSETKAAEPSASSSATSANPLDQFKDRYTDTRQRTPYYASGGEKTSLFDEGPALGRTTSTRTPPRRTDIPGTFPRTRQRSTSTPKTSSNDGGSEDSTKVNTGANGPVNRKAPANSSFQSRASERYKPKADLSNTTPHFRAATAEDHSSEPVSANDASTPRASSAQTNGGGPSVYAPPPSKPSHLPQSRTQFHAATARPDRAKEHAPRARDWLSIITGFNCNPPSSEDSSEGAKSQPPTLLPYEEAQRQAVAHLIREKVMLGQGLNRLSTETKNRAENTSHVSATRNMKNGADTNGAFSFNFSAEQDTTGNDTNTKHFTKSSADSINTRFVEDEDPDGWQFKAGSATANEPPTPSKARPQSRSRLTRRQTPRSRPAPTDRVPSMQAAMEEPAMEDAQKQRFSPGEWSEKIGSQHFEPQPPSSASTSPTRRGNSRKPKPVKMTAGTAGLVDGEESEDWQEIPRPSSGAAPPSTLDPNAMDIDPPSENVEDTPKAAQTHGARTIPVEPHREDWRAGNLNGTHSKSAIPTLDTDPARVPFAEAAFSQSTSAPTTANPFVPAGGSEDTDEFRATFSDFKNVEPFADPAPTGLKSFADLKSTLPFESQPSEQIPLEKEIPSGPLAFPIPPVAPRLPPTMGVAGIRPNIASFRKYAQDFYNYMDKWESFNDKIMMHFASRQGQFKERRRQRGAAWLDTQRGGDDAGDYLMEIDQDQAVRAQWLDAFAEHQKKVTEFRDFRQRVK
ncbi:Uu.00g017400.m01.CDS01 [Anthostomella pinea]|uniref:Uu.00g017400.m01.CDS01 n=1 Tax=Anthostomella pinea TaxID=933095 RepID=A0AAI8VYX8_9PEZI|nr:Uu.00g017400.m01.CDS01 [Anthostomella pinea]